MTSNLAISLLRRGNNGNQILEILDTLVNDVTNANIEDCASYYNEISAPTADPIQF